jgi:tRNA/tmRNA/rRNA uracil-C5-methylase (TrmA/RlmC/RlmD family)
MPYHRCMDATMKLTIDSLAYGGDAVARAEDGRAVFVAGAVPGDVVTARAIEVHDRYIRASVTEVLEPSPERRKPPCPYFGECGGCQWQHVSHTAQLVAKRQAVTDALIRIGGVTDPAVGDVLTGGHAYGYRNRVELTVGEDARGGLALGLCASGSQRLVPVESCLLLPEKRRGYPRRWRARFATCRAEVLWDSRASPSVPQPGRGTWRSTCGRRLDPSRGPPPCARS